MAPAEIELENTARLLDPERPHTIVVAGGGHAAHVLLGLLGSNPLYTVKLWDSRAHHLPTWRAQLGASGGTVAVTNEGASGDGSGPIEGRVAAVSDDPADVVPGADMIIIAAPAFAHEAYLKGSAPFVTDSTVVGTMVAAGGFEWALRDAYGDRVDRMVTFGMETLPWACRRTVMGRSASILGTKVLIHVAVTPPGSYDAVLCFLNSALSVGALPWYERAAGGYASTTLMNANAYYHPAIMHGQFAGWDGSTPYEQPPLFYQGVTQERVGELLEQLSVEHLAIKAAVQAAFPALDLSGVVALPSFYYSLYPDQIGDWTNLASALRSNRAYQGLRHYMKPAPGGGGGSGGLVPDLSVRYLTEDIPFGLVPIKGIALCAGVATPTVDRLLRWCQRMMGKEYLCDDGSLQGRDLGETRCPQRYGLKTLADLVTCDRSLAPSIEWDELPEAPTTDGGSPSASNARAADADEAAEAMAAMAAMLGAGAAGAAGAGDDDDDDDEQQQQVEEGSADGSGLDADEDIDVAGFVDGPNAFDEIAELPRKVPRWQEPPSAEMLASG